MPIDVLWFRVPRDQVAPPTLGYLGGGQIVIAIDRGDYWQCGTIIDKGSLTQVQAAGLAAYCKFPSNPNPENKCPDWVNDSLLD